MISSLAFWGNYYLIKNKMNKEEIKTLKYIFLALLLSIGGFLVAGYIYQYFTIDFIALKYFTGFLCFLLSVFALSFLILAISFLRDKYTREEVTSITKSIFDFNKEEKPEVVIIKNKTTK